MSLRSTARCAGCGPPDSALAASRSRARPRAASGREPPTLAGATVPRPADGARRVGGCRARPRCSRRLERCRRVGARADLMSRPSRAAHEPVVITGAALGLPGAERLFDDANIARLLNGEQGIDVIPGRSAPRDARQARHPPGQERGRPRHVRDDRPSRRRDQARRARRRVRPGGGVRGRRRSDAPRSGAPRSWRSPRASTRCATRASRSSCATRRRPRARSSRTAGRCRTSCATTPA